MTDIDVRQLRSTHIIFSAMDLDVGLLDNLDIKFHQQKIDDWLWQYELKIDPDDIHNGGNIIQWLNKAEEAQGLDRIDLIAKSYRKAQSFYYGMWANGKIKAKKEPMPDDVKEMLRDRAQPKPLAQDLLNGLTVRMIEGLPEHKVDGEFARVFGPPIKAHTTEYKRKSLIAAITKAVKETVLPATPDNVPSAPKPKPVAAGSKVKVPLYLDKEAQKEKEKAYPWVKSGSWRKDPEKETGSLADIVCQACGALREVHAGDLFQCKLCRDCKKSKPSK